MLFAPREKEIMRFRMKAQMFLYWFGLLTMVVAEFSVFRYSNDLMLQIITTCTIFPIFILYLLLMFVARKPFDL